MQWDLGVQGITVLAGMSLAFGLLVQTIWGWSSRRWLWAAASAAGFALGLLVSEGWFGWATEEELQPNIDGLSFDETMLALVLVLAAVLVARVVVRRHARHSGGSLTPPGGAPLPH